MAGEDQGPIKKNQSVTESERYLQKLCNKTFLSLWSYPSVFRDQKDARNPEGKELCDVLVVFGNHIIVFSDKRITFPQTGSIELDWSRWYRKAVKDSAKQAWGAERWIKNFPDRIYLDRKCTIPFPYKLPNVNDMKIHIVVVSHEASDKFRKESKGGSGSMMLYSSIPEYNGKPFMISDIDKERTFVHVFDDTSLDIVLNTNDTVSDFVQYLTKKEDFFRSDIPFVVAGEEELLAYYLLNADENGNHSFSFDKKYKGLGIEEGMWRDFQNSPERKWQIAANKASYFWDSLIENFNENVLSGTQYFGYNLKSAERVLRVMAAESRMHRRLLSNAFIELVAQSDTVLVNKRFVLPINSDSPYYMFLLYPRLGNISEEEYRKQRSNNLYANCIGLKYKLPEAEYIVGIAVEPGANFGTSEDSLYLDVRNWSEKDRVDALELMKEFGIPETVPQKQIRTEPEYPDTGTQPFVKGGKIPRNDPCPCGSGIKYKKCHGKD